MTRNYSLFVSEEIFVLLIQLFIRKKDPLWWGRWISFIKAYLIYCKTKPKKIIRNVQIWSTGREINSAVLHSTNGAQWSILKLFYTKNGKNMEAELKIQMKVPNKEQAIVSVYSLEKKRVYFRPLRVFWAVFVYDFSCVFLCPINSICGQPNPNSETWHTRDFTLSVHVQT